MSGVATAVVGSALISADASRSAANTSSRAANYAADLEMEQFETTRRDMLPWQQAGASAINRLSTSGDLRNRGRSLAERYIPDSEVPEFDMSRVNIYEDPGYQFRMDEAMKQIDRVSAGKGKLLSGERLENVISRSQDIASQEYGNAYNRAMDIYGIESGVEAERRNRGIQDFAREYGLETDYLNNLRNIAGTGQTAASNVASAGATAARGAGANIRAAGDARAAGRIGQAGAVGGAIRDISMLYGMGAFNSPPALPAPTTPPPTIQPTYGGGYAYA